MAISIVGFDGTHGIRDLQKENDDLQALVISLRGISCHILPSRRSFAHLPVHLVDALDDEDLAARYPWIPVPCRRTNVP